MDTKGSRKNEELKLLLSYHHNLSIKHAAKVRVGDSSQGMHSVLSSVEKRIEQLLLID